MVQYGLYCKTIKNLGTEKHRELLLDGTSLRTFGCFGLTEIAHGSNVRGITTTAEYDPETEEFILHSPSKTAAKFWIGNLAKTAQNAIIFAQLITLGENKGVHAFVVEVRDRNNHVAHPGIEIGDCGDKKGAHGIDNGWILFDNYRVSRDCLLDKFGSVNKGGEYYSSIKSDGKRFANSIASLSGGRVLIGRLSTEGAIISTNITLRFACARRQFGPANGPEVALISYPSYQYRIITRFIDHFITLIANNRMVDIWLKNLPNLMVEKNRINNLCHGLCSNIKAFAIWDSQDTISECRRACGGLGYSKYALFGDILNINDLNQTWEGDNHVLMMQAQQFLFKCMSWLGKGDTLPETVEWLTLSPPDLDDYKP
jgi:acyl-CoA oxidase